MSEVDRPDIIQAASEEGEDLFLSVERYFYYNGEEYVLLRQVQDAQGAPLPGEPALHVMQVAVSQDEAGDEVEDFVPVEASLADSLLQAASIQYTKPDEGQGTDE